VLLLQLREHEETNLSRWFQTECLVNILKENQDDEAPFHKIITTVKDIATFENTKSAIAICKCGAMLLQCSTSMDLFKSQYSRHCEGRTLRYPFSSILKTETPTLETPMLKKVKSLYECQHCLGIFGSLKLAQEHEERILQHRLPRITLKLLNQDQYFQCGSCERFFSRRYLTAHQITSHPNVRNLSFTEVSYEHYEQTKLSKSHRPTSVGA
jgi:hypothetical protein